MDVIEDVLNVILAALAAWQVTEVLHHAEITLPIRRLTSGSAPRGALLGFFTKLYNCPFCLSHWVTGLIVVLLLTADRLPYGNAIVAVIWIFAVTRLANLGNDLAYNYTRTPRFEVEEKSDLEIEDELEEGTDEDDGADLRG
jgi:hypothetical protein